MAMRLNENLDDNGEMHEINVTPFIDVMLVLLIIVTEANMINALDSLTAGKKDTTVFFRADKTVDYETMMKVMDTLHQAGYLKIGLVGEEKAAAK